MNFCFLQVLLNIVQFIFILIEVEEISIVCLEL